jgi:zinc D-Ala-D-Ala carboxypeptidase
MNESQIASAKLLCENVFEPLRIHLNTPINISSGFRCVQLNKMIKGSSTSQHTKGEAMDLQIGSKGFNFIKDKLEFDQLIWEFGNDENPSWVHVSFSSKNRKQVLKATKKNGKTIYSNY